MVKATPGLDIARNVGGQRLAFRSNPVNDWTLHSFGVISPSTSGTFLNLFVVSARCVC